MGSSLAVQACSDSCSSVRHNAQLVEVVVSKGSSLLLVRDGDALFLLLVKNWGGGKNTHSVLDGLPFQPMCTSRPNRARWLWMRASSSMSVVQVGKGNAPSLT